MLTALYNAGALQKVERAGLLSTLEKAGALSQIEKLLPLIEQVRPVYLLYKYKSTSTDTFGAALIEQYKPISLAKSVLSIPAGTFYAGAAGTQFTCFTSTKSTNNDI